MIRDDKRTDEQRQQTCCYVVAADSFMAGWGHAFGRSLLAIACTD